MTRSGTIPGLISDGVAIPSRIASGKAIAGGRIDHHGRGATRHSETGQSPHLVTSRFEFVVDGLGHIGLDRKLIEARRVWEEGSVKVAGLHTGPLEGGVQVRGTSRPRNQPRSREPGGWSGPGYRRRVCRGPSSVRPPGTPCWESACSAVGRAGESGWPWV